MESNASPLMEKAAKWGEACCGAGVERNISDMERWTSLAVGAGLTLYGLKRISFRGVALTAIGASLAYRGLTGHCTCYQAMGVSTAGRPGATAVPARRGYKVEETVVIRRDVGELYDAWRNLADLPQIMSHLARVEPRGDVRSHWVAEGPMNSTVEWDAEIIEDRRGEVISWRSLPGADVDTAGSVHFKPAEATGETVVKVSLKYNPVGGKVGAQLVSFLGDSVEKKIHEDLRRFKQRMEQSSPAQPPSSSAAS